MRKDKSNERPIIFRSEMVKAILEGRKTMTRRIVKHPPIIYECFNHLPIYSDIHGKWYFSSIGLIPISMGRCPYGILGDRLWVRETWKCSALSHHTPTNGPESAEYSISYKPNGCFPNCKTFKFEKPMDNVWQKNRDGWRSSIHMPRWASRITLEITNIKVERLQEITTRDCIKEGFPIQEAKNYDPTRPAPKKWFRDVWDSIYGKDAWERNDWIWVISFKRLEAK